MVELLSGTFKPPSTPQPLEPTKKHQPNLVALSGPPLATMAIMAPTTVTVEVCVWAP